MDERRKAKIFSYQLRAPHKESGSSHLPNRKNGTERITWELVALEYVGRGKGDIKKFACSKHILPALNYSFTF